MLTIDIDFKSWWLKLGPGNKFWQDISLSIHVIQTSLQNDKSVKVSKTSGVE